MAASNRPTIKNDEAYDTLREKGYSKSKAAAIANAQANDGMSPSAKGGKSAPYEEWTKEELVERAGQLDITGRWDMTKDELIDNLRG